MSEDRAADGSAPSEFQDRPPFRGDDTLACPLTGEPLLFRGDAFVTPSGRSYAFDDGILRTFVEADGSVNAATGTVQSFYEDSPFPNYNDFDTVESFVASADRGIFARMLREQIEPGSTILEVGCGTAQLSNYLAATTLARVYAADMTLASLKLGAGFARRNRLSRVRFAQMNLFRPCIRPGSVDVLISNGVLHHTADTKAALLSIAPLVRKGGYILIGLYNSIGRLRTDFRRVLYKIGGEWTLGLDPHLRNSLSPEKRRAWIRDQYLHPVERKHSMNEVLEWFGEAGIDFVSSIPSIVGEFSAKTRLFEDASPGTSSDRRMAELSMLFSTYGGEGGLFIMIGRKT
jgi:2-polyprenyl-3-methyl-5-hydroxy-6-metoxy-1,4-benzoquinol methylase